MDLCGGHDPHLTFDRYFRLGRWAQDEDSGLVLPTSRSDLIRGRDVGAKRAALVGSPLVISPIESLVTAWSPGATRLHIHRAPPLGIDLAARGHEVGKILFKHFGHRIFGRGYDPDDVLQEVYKGIMARNRGKSPFDVRKSSFGHYVHMVCRCVLWNYERREFRRASNEVVGMTTVEDGQIVTTDAALAAQEDTREPSWSDPWAEEGVMKAEHDLGLYIRSQDASEGVMAVLPLMREGWTRQEMADHLGVSKSTLNKLITELRSYTRIWAS